MNIFRQLKRFFHPNVWDLTTIVQWAVVLLPTVATSVTGILSNESLFWIIVGTTLAFAGTFTGLVTFKIYRFQNDPRHKFKFMRPVVNRPLNAVRIGFEIANDAVFPINVEIVELRTSCSTRTTPVNRPLRNNIFDLAPGERTFYNDAVIDIQGVADVIMIGRLEVSIKYGHSGKRVFEISKDYDLYIPLNSNFPIDWTTHSS